MLSPKKQKKVRKILTRKIKKQLIKKTTEIIKPRPKFLPKIIWKGLIFLLLDIDKNEWQQKIQKSV